MKKILLLVDVRDWAYDICARHWKDLLQNEYRIDILYLSDFKVGKLSEAGKKEFLLADKKKKVGSIERRIVSEAIGKIGDYKIIRNNDWFINEDGEPGFAPVFDHNIYDGIVFFYHRAILDSRLIATPIPYNKVAICINNEKWADEGVMDTYNRYLKDAKVVAGCNNKILSTFGPICPRPLARISQAIDNSIFFKNRNSYSSNRVNSEFRVGWSGDFENKIKNIDIAKQICELSNVTFSCVKDKTQQELNLWYNEIDAVLCTSRSEGGPLMLLEAGACGLPIITAPVGLAPEIIKNGQNGFLFNLNNIGEAVHAINQLKNDMVLRESVGMKIEKETIKNWTYIKRADEVRIFLNELCS